jgi:ATP-binding cassette subfamily B protein
MRKVIEERFALTRKGAADFLRGVAFTSLLNIALMLTAVYMFIFLDEYPPRLFDPDPPITRGLGYYIALALGSMGVLFVIAVFQYRSSYTTVYEESAHRRVSLAEKLRRLPLALFGEKNLSDLTSTIVDDSTELEHTFSHAVPQLFASIISVVLIAVGLFVFTWQLSLAVLWVVPIAGAVVLLSKRVRQKESCSGYAAKREVTEGIQEGLETI